MRRRKSTHAVHTHRVLHRLVYWAGKRPGIIHEQRGLSEHWLDVRRSSPRHGNQNEIANKLPLPRPRVNPTSHGEREGTTRTEAVRRLDMLERLPTIISCWVFTLPPTHTAGQVVVFGARGSPVVTVPGARGSRPVATLPHRGDAGDAREGGSQGPGTAAAARSRGSSLETTLRPTERGRRRDRRRGLQQENGRGGEEREEQERRRRSSSSILSSIEEEQQQH